MKKFFAALISAVIVLSLAACSNGNKPDSGNSTSAPTTSASTDAPSSIESPLALLNTVWGSYAEQDKFAAAGGDSSEENMVMDAPGKYGIEDTAALDSALGFPAASADKIDSAASLMHMMNANTFTCGAFHVKNAADVSEIAAAIKGNVMQRRWMCGFPDKLVVVVVDDYVISFFGSNDIIDTFKTNLISAYPSAQLISEDAVV